MKTAEQWWQELRQGTTQVAIATMPDIRMIQADAILHCAELVNIISRGTKSEDRAIAIDEARDLIISEVKLLE